jgi:hypothetical protein
VKTTVIALAAAALIAGAPAVFAQGVSSKTPGLHKLSKKHHPGASGYAPRREMQARSWKKGYPGAFGYAPGEPRGSTGDYTIDASRQAGGGGGGGGGSGM